MIADGMAHWENFVVDAPPGVEMPPVAWMTQGVPYLNREPAVLLHLWGLCGNAAADA